MKNEKKLKKEGYNSLTSARRQKPLRKIEGKTTKTCSESTPVEEREKKLFEKF